MEISLLCDEMWLSNESDCCLESCADTGTGSGTDYSFYSITKEEDCEEAFIICLEKEPSYMPQPGYVQYLLHSNNLIQYRSKAIQWLIKSRSRLNLSFGTVFNAANYLDRFISINHHNVKEWKCWMVELLSVACLSVASKFSDTYTPLLHQIQMEDLEYSFESSTIRRMELTLLHALQWRLGCITTLSYVEMLPSNVASLKPHLHNELTAQVTKLLLGATLDLKLLEYPPSVIAVSAIWCSLDELIPSSYSSSQLSCITRLFNQHQKVDDIVKCNAIMKSQSVVDSLIVCGQAYQWPSSPVTVLMKERIDVYDYQVDLSIFDMTMPCASTNAKNKLDLESCKKRRKIEH